MDAPLNIYTDLQSFLFRILNIHIYFELKYWKHIITYMLDLLMIIQVFLVGHDWGAIIAWHLCLLRPDRIKALVNMSVVFHPRHPKRKPIESMRAVLGDDYYICRFQVHLPLLFCFLLTVI